MSFTVEFVSMTGGQEITRNSASSPIPLAQIACSTVLSEQGARVILPRVALPFIAGQR